MNKIILIITIYFFLPTYSIAQNTVKIIVNTNPTKNDEHVFIAGNVTELGSWYPNLIRMDKNSDSVWTAEFSFSSETKLEFKFTKGSWQNEALNQDKSVPGNNTLTVTNDTTLVYNINYWKDEYQFKPKESHVTGYVDYYRKFSGKNLLERDLIVWLPTNYEKDFEKRYPVLYMHDAQNIFDPSTSSIGIDWQMDETADSLIKAELIEPIIIVGIYNTINRSLEYSNGDTGKYYMEFIVEQVKPFIDSVYRTKPDRENTATAGASLGGLISFMLAWEHTDVFSKSACLSPAFFYKKYPWLDFITPVKNYEGDKKPLQIYIDNGELEVDSILQQGVDQMLFELEQKNYVIGNDLIYFKDYGANHNEEAWAKRTWRFLKYFFGAKE